MIVGSHCWIFKALSDLFFRKTGGYHEGNALGSRRQILSNSGEMMSILVAVIINKVESADWREVKDQRDSEGEMPDRMIHWMSGLKSQG